MDYRKLLHNEEDDLKASAHESAAELEYSPVFFGTDGLDGLFSVDGFDKALAEGVHLLSPIPADFTNDKTRQFMEEYDKTLKDAQEKGIDVPELPLITYLAKKEKGVKLFYHDDVRDIIKDVYKHV